MKYNPKLIQLTLFGWVFMDRLAVSCNTTSTIVGNTAC